MTQLTEEVGDFAHYKFDVLDSMRGDQFDVMDESGNQAVLTLVDVKKSSLDGVHWEAFSAIYKGEQSIRIPQGTYRLHHRTFGALSLFLSPKSEVDYEVVVTRRKPVASPETSL